MDIIFVNITHKYHGRLFSDFGRAIFVKRYGRDHRKSFGFSFGLGGLHDTPFCVSLRPGLVLLFGDLRDFDVLKKFKKGSGILFLYR